MNILEIESREVNSKFKGFCPLCKSKVAFTVEKRKIDLPHFFCPSCKAEWEYWEDWEKPGMKGARLAKPGINGEGREHMRGFLETLYWQQLIDSFRPVELTEFEAKEQVVKDEQPSQEEIKLSTYSIYNFQLDYPSDCKIILGRQNGWGQGELDFRSPTGFIIKVIWGLLDRVKSMYPLPSRLADAHIANIRKMKKVEDLTLLEQKSVEVQGHEGIFNHIKITAKESSLFKKSETTQVNLFLHVYCEKTHRYFILLYEPSRNEELERPEILFDSIIKSFNCHAS